MTSFTAICPRTNTAVPVTTVTRAPLIEASSPLGRLPAIPARDDPFASSNLQRALRLREPGARTLWRATAVVVVKAGWSDGDGTAMMVGSGCGDGADAEPTRTAQYIGAIT